jgi:hypothetical protein
MSEFIGREIDFALAPESVRGTAETVAQRNVRKVTCNIIPKAERVVDDTTFGRIEDAERIRTVRKWNEGDVSGIVHVDVLGYYLWNIYGEVDSGASSGDAFEHTFTMEQSILHPSLTLFVKDSDVRQEKLAGGMITTLELTATTDNYVRYTANFIAKEGETDTSEIPALATEYDFVGRDITVKIASTEAGLANATALKLKDLNLTFNTNAEADFTFGSYSPDEIYNKQFSIEGSLTRNFVDETFKDLYEGNDFVYMQIEIEGEAILDEGVSPKITILGNKIQVQDWTRTSEGDALVTEDVKFKFFYNTDDESMSEVTLKNLTEEYNPLS